MNQTFTVSAQIQKIKPQSVQQRPYFQRMQTITFDATVLGNNSRIYQKHEPAPHLVFSQNLNNISHDQQTNLRKTVGGNLYFSEGRPSLHPSQKPSRFTQYMKTVDQTKKSSVDMVSTMNLSQEQDQNNRSLYHLKVDLNNLSQLLEKPMPMPARSVEKQPQKISILPPANQAVDIMKKMQRQIKSRQLLYRDMMKETVKQPQVVFAQPAAPNQQKQPCKILNIDLKEIFSRNIQSISNPNRKKNNDNQNSLNKTSMNWAHQHRNRIITQQRPAVSLENTSQPSQLIYLNSFTQQLPLKQQRGNKIMIQEFTQDQRQKERFKQQDSDLKHYTDTSQSRVQLLEDMSRNSIYSNQRSAIVLYNKVIQGPLFEQDPRQSQKKSEYSSERSSKLNFVNTTKPNTHYHHRNSKKALASKQNQMIEKKAIEITGMNLDYFDVKDCYPRNRQLNVNDNCTTQNRGSKRLSTKSIEQPLARYLNN